MTPQPVPRPMSFRIPENLYRRLRWAAFLSESTMTEELIGTLERGLPGDVGPTGGKK